MTVGAEKRSFLSSHMEFKGNNKDHRIVSKTLIMIELEMTNVEYMKLHFYDKIGIAGNELF